MDKKMLKDELERVDLLLQEMALLQSQLDEALNADEPDGAVLEGLDTRMGELMQRVDKILGSGGVRS